MSKKQKHPKLDKNDGKLKTKSKKVVEIPIFVPAFNLPYDYEAVAWDEDQIAGVMMNLKQLAHARNGTSPVSIALRGWDYLPHVEREKHYRHLARLRIAQSRIRFGIDQAQQQVTDLAMHRTVLTQKIEAIREARQAVEALPFPDVYSNKQTEYLKVLEDHEPDLVEERQAIIDQHGAARLWRRDATRELKTMCEQEVVFRKEVDEQVRLAKSIESNAKAAWSRSNSPEPQSVPDEEFCPPIPFKGFDTATVIRFRKWLGEENGNRVFDYVAIRRNNEDEWSVAGGVGNYDRNYSWSALLDFMRSDETKRTIQRVYDSMTLLCDAPESMQPRRPNWRRSVLSWPSYLITRWDKKLLDYKELLDGTPVMLRDGGPRSLPINGATQVGPLYEGGPVATISTSIARASMI